MSTKRFLFTTGLLISALLSVFCQNKLKNGNFNSGSFDYGAPSWENFNENIDDWEGRMWINTTIGSSWHSPDWSDLPKKPYGDRYIGIKSYEVFQQELTGSNKLEESKHYLIKMEIYIDSEYWNYDKLHLYLTKKKINYKKESLGIGQTESEYRCSEDYCNFEDGPLQTIILIDKFDLAHYPNGVWIEIKTIFNTPQDGFTGFFINDYNWFGVELVNKGDWEDDGYLDCSTLEDLYIDNISLEEVSYCTFNDCVRTDGPIVATSVLNIDHDYSKPHYVTNLFNVESATSIEIKNISGLTIRTLPNVSSVNGIKYPIYWDGKTSSGTQAVEGSYIWQMQLENECGTYTYTENFVKGATITSNPPTNPTYSTIQTPLPCCGEEEDILLSNMTISGAGEIEYVAQNDIDITDVYVLSSVSDLSFQAGSSISISSDLHIQQGAIATFFVEPCAESGPYKSKLISMNDALISPSQQDEYQTDIALGTIEVEEGFKIYPNPITGNVHIDIIDPTKSLYKIEVYNQLGRKLAYTLSPDIKTNIVDLGDEREGLYYLLLYWNDNEITRKQIILRK